MAWIDEIRLFLTANYMSLISIGVSIAVGILVFGLDSKRQQREEEHARKTIIENLTEGAKIFNELSKVARRPESEDVETEVLSEIDYYFQENHEKIRDIIRFTKIYLNEWKNLPYQDKKKIDLSLKDLSWLLTEYYPIHKPDLIKHGKALENRTKLTEKKNEVTEILNEIKNR